MGLLRRGSTGRSLLVLYGHSSRHNPTGIQELADAEIDTLIIPAHSSHVTQPHDCLGISRVKHAIQRARGPSTTTQAKQVFSDALNSGLVSTNVRASFEGAGIWPLNESQALKRGMAGTRTQDEKVSTPQKRRRGVSISGQEITSPEMIEVLESTEARRSKMVKRQVPKPKRIPVKKGRGRYRCSICGSEDHNAQRCHRKPENQDN